MGCSSSRLGCCRARVNGGLKRRLSSLLICGSAASTSNNPPTTIPHMDDYPAELLACSYESGDHPLVNGLKENSPISCSESQWAHSSIEASSDNNNDAVVPLLTEYYSRPSETSNGMKCLSESKELVSEVLNLNHNSVVPYSERTSEIGSSSTVEQQSLHLVSGRDNLNACVEVDFKIESRASIISEELHSNNSLEEGGYLHQSGASPVDDSANSIPIIQDSSLASVLGVSDSMLSLQSGIETTEEASLDPGLFMLDREQDRSNGDVLHVDVVSISSSRLFSSSAEGTNHEARRNSRRLFWDAFSRRSSRRHSDSRALVFSSEDTDDLGSRDRWLLDFSGDFLEGGIGSDPLGHRNRGRHEGRWHSRSEIWERFRGGFSESRPETTFCASGLHPDGTCSCESFLTTEEASTRGSISRIVMLAEALFEVLDEIHRQPMSLSLSMVSVPAPEVVVNSFPLKSHKKPSTSEAIDQDVEQCYICLADYEEGDEIRVLPCCHEYHMSCVDKWLKEIHGVCPLCRGDVCASLVEGSIPAS